MKELIASAAGTGADFEIYSRSLELKSVVVENSEVKGIEASLTSGVSLRLLKDGKSGFSFTRNLINPDVLVRNAVASLKGGVDARFLFPATRTYANVKTHSENAVRTSADDLVAESLRIRDLLTGKSGEQINSGAQLFITECRLINSAGTDVSWKESNVEISGSIVSRGGSTYSAVDVGFDLHPMSGASLENVLRLYEADHVETRPVAGKHKVLFMPRAMNTILWRLQSGTSGQSLHQGISPLAGKMGEKSFSDILTLRNNPLNDSIPGARAVDDEGVPCSDFALIDRGVFKGFYYDLNYSTKANVAPTGNGFRRTMWGVDPIMVRPQPYLGHLYFDKGEKSFDELLKDMGTGIVVFGALGEHTGNIPNGDFSIGLSLGLFVENGRIAGKCKDTMISGNVYDIMKRAVAVGSESEPAYSNNPPVLFDGVDVSS